MAFDSSFMIFGYQCQSLHIIEMTVKISLFLPGSIGLYKSRFAYPNDNNTRVDNMKMNGKISIKGGSFFRSIRRWNVSAAGVLNNFLYFLEIVLHPDMEKDSRNLLNLLMI